MTGFIEKMMNDFFKADLLKAKLDTYCPLNTQVVNNLHDNLVLQWTYHSNAIEGNTLTLKETKVALEGITIGGKTLREHFEAINHRDAILFVEERVGQQQTLNEWTIKALHQLVLKNIDSHHAGCYRQVNVLISGAEHRPPHALQVPEQMAAFIHWCNHEAQVLHPIERAARVHVDFLPALKSGDSRCQTAKSRRENVFGSVGIAVVCCTTFAANPCSYSQTCSTFRSAGGNFPAARTGLG